MGKGKRLREARKENKKKKTWDFLKPGEKLIVPNKNRMQLLGERPVIITRDGNIVTEEGIINKDNLKASD